MSSLGTSSFAKSRGSGQVIATTDAGSGGSITTQASGSTFVIAVAWAGAAFGSIVPTDNKGNTYVQVPGSGEVAYDSAGVVTRLFWAQNATGGSGHVFSFDPLGSGFPALMVEEVMNCPASPQVAVSGQETGTSPFTTPNISPSFQSLMMAFGWSNAPSGTETDLWNGSFSSGDLRQAITDASTSVPGSFAAKDQSAGGPFNGSMTVSGVTVTDTAMWIIAVEGNPTGISLDVSRGQVLAVGHDVTITAPVYPPIGVRGDFSQFPKNPIRNAAQGYQ